MKSRWNQFDLDTLVASYAQRGINQDRAIRTYTTRILGQEPLLVLHGGGNTSVKTRMVDMLGVEHDVLCVKGSGWDMGTIEPEGLPAVQLEPLAALARIPQLSDEDLVAAQRRMLLDPYAPNPSIEAVLHAIIEYRHVDHTHANAIISLTNQPDGAQIIRDVFPDATIVPYVMPGFALARDVRRILDETPGAKSLILLNHGIFTFHDDPRQAYEDMIAMCDAAERRLAKGKPQPFQGAALPDAPPHVEEIAPLVRGALARMARSAEGGAPAGQAGQTSGHAGRDRLDRWLLEFRTSPQIRHFVDGKALCDYGRRGNATPDHSIRIKRYGMVAPPAGDAGFADKLGVATENFARDYSEYFARQNARTGGLFRELDRVPRIVYVPGLGLFGVGRTAKDAAICADIAEATVDVITRAEGIGRFAALPEADLFDVEYWPLEQAKLAKAAQKPLHRQIAVVTGGACGLGYAIAEQLRGEGAEVALFDIDGRAVEEAAHRLGALAVPCDVTDRAAVDEAVARVVGRFGGVDILISNAGAAFQGRMTDIDDALFEKSVALNFWSHHLMARACVQVMQAQRTGGALVFNVTKQVLNPGPDFGPYGIAKSALMALMRQYAIEHGGEGITANAVNADRIRTGLLTDGFIGERARSRGLTVDEYMRGNLLGREVAARDVADAFVHLAKARATSGAILTVDGGNVAAMVR